MRDLPRLHPLAPSRVHRLQRQGPGLHAVSRRDHPVQGPQALLSAGSWHVARALHRAAAGRARADAVLRLGADLLAAAAPARRRRHRARRRGARPGRGRGASARKYHLDRPVLVQYGIWIGKVLRGDFGESLRNRIPVSELLASKLPVTVELARRARCSSRSLIGIPPASSRPPARARAIDVAANARRALRPLGAALLARHHAHPALRGASRLAARLRLRAAVGGPRAATSPRSCCRRSCSAPAWPGVMMRHTRGAMLQTLGADYVRTARAKSVPERLVVLKHALRNALIPVITLGAIEFGRLLSGAVLTEQIFAIPGFGKMLVDGVFNRDYAVVQGVVLVSAGALRAAEPRSPTSSTSWPTRGCGAHVSATSAAPPARRGGRAGARARRGRLARRPAAVIAAAVVRGVRRHRGGRPAPGALRSDRARTSCAIRKAPSAAPSARHRRGRPRRALAPHLGRAGLAAGRRHPGHHRGGAQHPAGAPRRATPGAGSTGSSCASPTPCSPSRSSSWPSRSPPSWARASATP